MYINSIELTNWKAFEYAELSFGKFKKNKNVVLIGADNGYGKTSLLEALVLCLFGRDGMKDVARGKNGVGGLESYDRFLEKALHSSALKSGNQKMSVLIKFTDVEGGQYAVYRSWYFTRSGGHKAADEEVRLYEGRDEDLVRIPRNTDPVDFVRNWVTTNVVPVSLLGFFLFDGEIVRQLADESMSAQVRHGIEGILGVPTLKELAEDLGKYAYHRMREAGTVDTDHLSRLMADASRLEKEYEDAKAELDNLRLQLQQWREARDGYTTQLATLNGGAAFASLKDVLEQRQKVQLNRDRLRTRVNEILAHELALALVAQTLVAQTVAQLRGELAHTQWIRSRAQVDQLERLVAQFSDLSAEIQPELSATQSLQVVENIRQAWHALWFPPPSDAIETPVHPYLDESEKRLVIAGLDQRTKGRIREMLDSQAEVAANERELRKLDQQAASAAPPEAVADLRAKLEAAQSTTDSVSRSIGDAERRSVAIASELKTVKTTLGQMNKQLGDSTPTREKAALAQKYAQVIKDAIDAALPAHIEEVANAMTAAYSEIAHKQVVKKIEIDKDCTVRLLAEDRGRNLRELDQSAGEAQVFALSLISAIIRVSGFRFPIVMDTPIARLDAKHRLRVLRHFAELDGQQLVLLSQPTEVHGQYLDALRSRVGAAYRFEFTALANGQGRSRVTSGYFEEI